MGINIALSPGPQIGGQCNRKKKIQLWMTDFTCEVALEYLRLYANSLAASAAVILPLPFYESK